MHVLKSDGYHMGPSGDPMAFGLFKDGEELFDSALEEIKRKEYDKAQKTLNKALDKNTKNADIARVYIAFISVGNDLNSPGAYDGLKNRLESLKQDSFQFGLATFDTEMLKKECACMSACISARNMSDSSAKGNALMEAARNLMAAIGNNNLRINEYYSGNAITGTRMATGLMAEANEILADDIFESDPQKAAEYQQQAYNFRRQNGESGEANLRKMQQYSKACTCWICGRQVVGEGLHFFLMSANPSPQQVEKDKGEIQHSISESRDLYVCRACYTAISRRADAIANGYYDKALDQMRAGDAALQAQILAMDARITRLQTQISFMRN